MSRNEDVTTAIWVDLMDLPNPDAKLLYLWSFTNEHNGWAGLYKIHEAIMTVETGLPQDRLTVALADVSTARFAFFEQGVMWVRTRARRIRSKSPQMAKSIAKDVSLIAPDHPLRGRFLAEYADDAWLRDALKGTYTAPIGNLSEKPVGKPDSDRSTEPSRRVPRSGEGERLKEKLQLPKELPGELHANLRTVYRVLTGYAERHNAKAINPLSLASVAMARQHRPLVKAACDWVAWAEAQAQPRKDAVAGWRNWLDRENDLAGFEQLGPDGMPATNRRVPELRTVIGAKAERDQVATKRLAALDRLTSQGDAA